MCPCILLYALVIKIIPKVKKSFIEKLFSILVKKNLLPEYKLCGEIGFFNNWIVNIALIKRNLSFFHNYRNLFYKKNLFS